MKLTELIDADLTPIKLLLDTVPPMLRKQAASALASGDELLSIAWLRALSLELESLILQLNAAVDGLLLLLVTRLKGGAITASYTKKQRSTWLSDLETALEFDKKEVKGWDAVEATRTDSNLIKHRLGVDFAPGEETLLSLKNVVQLTEETVLERFLGVRQWLVGLADSCRSLDESNGDA